MTDTYNKMKATLLHLLADEEMEIVATATDTFFETVEYPCCNLGFQKQVADIDVVLNVDALEDNLGLVALDINGFAVTSQLRSDLINNGCDESCFRRMTVEGQNDVLFQLIAPPVYRFWQNYLGDENEPCKKCERTIKYFENPEQHCVVADNDEPIGCIYGREDFQEVILNNDICSLICEQFKQIPVYTMPLYDYSMRIIMEGHAKDFNNVDRTRFEDSAYFDCLRLSELKAVLQFASDTSEKLIATNAYDRIKKMKNASINVKKEALLLYKKIGIK